MRDHAETNDNDLVTFQTYSENFSCVPNQTSNYDVFRLTNQHLTDHKAQTIWEYYRELFINAKLIGENLTSFRRTLQKFVENKSYDGDRQVAYPEGVAYTAATYQASARPKHTRVDDINRYIGLARWLELQYNVDTAIDQLSEGWTRESLEKAAKRIEGTVPFNNYVSYFTKDVDQKLKDPKDYVNRKLKVRSVYAYTHKKIRWYICASEYGAVKVWVHTKHNPFLDWFEREIKNGIEISVVTSKILCNIDDSTPYIKIENFFIDN